MRSGGRRQIDEIDSLGGPTQFFLDDRPAAPCERIGHYQRPCTHSPALILIHLQYRIFAKIGRGDPVRSHVAWQKSFSPPRQSPLTLHRVVVWRSPLARRSSAAPDRRDDRIKRQRSPKG